MLVHCQALNGVCCMSKGGTCQLQHVKLSVALIVNCAQTKALHGASCGVQEVSGDIHKETAALTALILATTS